MKGGGLNINIQIPGLTGKDKTKVLTTFTRQLAILVDAGLPLLRGLRVLEKQERNPTLKSIISELALSIEGGSTFPEGLTPKVFNPLTTGPITGILIRMSSLTISLMPITRQVEAVSWRPSMSCPRTPL